MVNTAVSPFLRRRSAGGVTVITGFVLSTVKLMTPVAVAFALPAISEATTLIAMTWSNADRSPAYHTPADTPDAVGLDALELAIRVGVGLAARIDEGKLD